MADVPRLDHLWDGLKDHHNNEKDHMVHERKNYKHAKMACFYKPHDSLATLGMLIGASMRLS